MEIRCTLTHILLKGSLQNFEHVTYVNICSNLKVDDIKKSKSNVPSSHIRRKIRQWNGTISHWYWYNALSISHGHFSSLHWRHNDHYGVSNHQPHGCLLKRLFRRRSKKTSKLRVTGLCVGNSPGPLNSPHEGPVTRKMFPFDDVIMELTKHNPCVPWGMSKKRHGVSFLSQGPVSI